MNEERALAEEFYYAESLRAVGELLQMVAEEPGHPSSSTVAYVLSDQLQMLATPRLEIDELIRISSGLLRMGGALETQDRTKAEVLKGKIAAAGEALNRRIHARALASAGEVLERGGEAQLRAALFWLNGTAGLRDLRVTRPMLRQELPEPFERLRRLALEKLERLERCQRELLAEQPRPAAEVRSMGLDSPSRWVDFLVCREDSGAVEDADLQRLGQVLDRLQRIGRLSVEGRELTRAGRYAVLRGSEKLPELVTVPGLRIEKDVRLFAQDDFDAISLLICNGRTSRPMGGVPIKLRAIKDRALYGRSNVFETTSLPDGRVTLPLIGKGDGRFEVTVEPESNFWNKKITAANLRPGDANQVDLSPLKGECWWRRELSRLDAPGEGEGVVIALIDSGVSPHKDLSPKGGFSVVDAVDAPWFEDPIGHGTQCAGIINGQGSGKSGIRGVAPRATLWVFRATDSRTKDDRGFQLSSLLEALYLAIELGNVDIINLSLGTREDSPLLREAIQAATDQGILVVAAAGNSSAAQGLYPALYESVLGVSAYGKTETFPADSLFQQDVHPTLSALEENRFFAAFSNFGSGVDLCAPGVAIRSTWRGADKARSNRDYVVSSGTSFACPFVSGAAACILSSRDDIQVMERTASRGDALRQAVLKACRPIGGLPESFQGRGRITW